MFKKLIIIVVFLLLLTGCEKDSQSISGEEAPVDTHTPNAREVIFEDLQFGEHTVRFVEVDGSFDFDKIEFPNYEYNDYEIARISVEAIGSKEDALKIGVAIIEYYWDRNVWTDISFAGIVHYKVDNIWLFTYGPDDIFVDGGVTQIAMNGDTGEIIVWWGEE